MDDDRLVDGEDPRECGACWAIPGAMVFGILMFLAFLSNFTPIAPAIAR